MLPTVVLTRPGRPDAQAWASRLATHGCHTLHLPLLDIRPHALAADSRQMLHRWQAPQPRQQRAHWRAVLFVSPQAVQHGMAHAGWPLPPGLRIWAPGPGTAAALMARGLDAAQIDHPPPHATQFDSENLWTRVQGQIRPGDAVLIVRGASASAAANDAGHGRDWLAARLRAAGARVQFLAVYQRARPHWGQTERQQARRAARDGSVWLFSNSEALAHLGQLLPCQHWGQARALATHPRVAAAAARLGFGSIHTCRPLPDEVCASIKSRA